MGEDRLGGDAEGYEYAGDGGVDAGVEEEEPNDCADCQIEALALDAQTRTQHEQRQKSGGVDKQHDVYLRGIESGDDDDAADVVGDGERGEENLQRHGHALPQEGEDAEREGDVRGHGDCGAAFVFGAVAEC